jgi:hypothetical protein
MDKTRKMSRKQKYTHWLERAEKERTKFSKKAEKTSIEQKLVKISRLLNEAAIQFEKIGYKLTSNIVITPYKNYSRFNGQNLAIVPGEKPPPSK